MLLFYPEPFSAEVIETYVAKEGQRIIEHDVVGHTNKLPYQDPECAGGYWATKLAANEFLAKRKRQAAYTSIRLIDGYDLPLGVVLVRETVREALNTKIFSSSNEEEFLAYLKKHFPKHYFYYIHHAKVPHLLRTQQRLTSFF